MPKLLVHSTDVVGATMSGPGIRAYHFAEQLREDFDVTLAAPNDPEVPIEGIDVVRTPRDARRLRDFALAFDVVVARLLPLSVMRALASSPVQVVYDLYVPVVTEQLAMLEVERTNAGAHVFHESLLLEHRFALATGNAFVCASERQRDFLLGMLAALGRVDRDQYGRDPTLRELVDVVPFGLPDEPPAASARVLRGVEPGIGSDDKLLIWGGGIWNWLDPDTVIRAVAGLGRDDVKLVFLGADHPDVPMMTAARRARSLVAELGVADTVLFRPGWVPYAERGRFLLEGDIGVSAHFDTIEARFAFRTRLLDHLWAGLPTITTQGDALGGLVAEEGLGRAVPAGDVDAWVRSIEELLDEGEAAAVRARVEAVRPRFLWSRSTVPLRRLARQRGEPVVARARGAAAATRALGLRARAKVQLYGPLGVVGRRPPRRG